MATTVPAAAAAATAIKRSLPRRSTPGAASSYSNTTKSIAFSGAGFLTSYHLGVAECLLKHGVILDSGSNDAIDSSSSPSSSSSCAKRLRPLLTSYSSTSHTGNTILSGVSGGALVAASICLSIRPEDGMTATIEIAQNARKVGGLLDHLHPGYV
jgi:hypothetical protein